MGTLEKYQWPIARHPLTLPSWPGASPFGLSCKSGLVSLEASLRGMAGGDSGAQQVVALVPSGSDESTLPSGWRMYTWGFLWSWGNQLHALGAYSIVAPGDGSLARFGISLLFVSLQTSPSLPLPHVSPCFLLLSPLDMRGLTRSSPRLQEHFGSSSVSRLSKRDATKYTFCFIPMSMVMTYILTHSSFTSHKPTLTSGSHL